MQNLKDKPDQLNEAPEEQHKPLVSRRRALQILAATGGGLALSNLPPKWEKPFIQTSVLPAFAQTSPAAEVEYPFTHVIENVSFEGDNNRLRSSEVQPGWLVVAPDDQPASVSSAASSYPWPWLAPGGCGCLKVKRKRKWGVVGLPPWWGGTVKIHIDVKFFPLPDHDDDETPNDDVEFGCFGISHTHLDLDDFPYYVVKAKIKAKKIQFTFQLPDIPDEPPPYPFYPIYFSMSFLSIIVLFTGLTLSPDFYYGPACFGSKVKSSFFD
jgi:hypothetical protein